MRFVPDARKKAPYDTRWRLSPEVVKEFIKVLGFEIEFGNAPPTA